MNQINPAIPAFRLKRKYQRRVRIIRPEISGTPRLNDQPGRKHGKRRAADLTTESLKWRTRFSAYRHGRPGNRCVQRRVEVSRV
jgi:hypothetical protein